MPARIDDEVLQPVEPTAESLVPKPRVNGFFYDTVEMELPAPLGSQWELFRDLQNKGLDRTNIMRPRSLPAGFSMLIQRVTLHAMFLDGSDVRDSFLRGCVLTFKINRRPLVEVPVLALAATPSCRLRISAQRLVRVVLGDWMQVKNIPTWVADLIETRPPAPLPDAFFFGSYSLASTSPELAFAADNDDLVGRLTYASDDGSIVMPPRGRLLVRVGLQGITHIPLGR